MKLKRNIILLFASALLLSCSSQPQVTKKSLVSESTIKPWAYWWWMGNSVTKDGITKKLTTYKKAGFDGFHIVPIYGEKGDEENFIEFLPPK
jgi:hypothetical protein